MVRIVDDLAARARTSEVQPRRVAVRGLTALGILGAFAYWLYLTANGGNPVDFRIYYNVDLNDLYGGWVVGGPDSFQYAPVFAQVMAVLRVLPFDVLLAIWRGVSLAIVVWLCGPISLLAVFWDPVAAEVNAGNVNIFIAAAIFSGFRRPGSWAFVLLTKITPAVGLLWFAVRREWPALRRVAAVTGAIVAGSVVVSLLTAPGQWLEWLSLLASHSSDAVPTFPFWVPLVIRLPIAVLIVVIGARFGWRATVGLAAVVAAPVLYFPTQSIVLAAVPPLRDTAGRLLDRLMARRSDVSGGQQMTANLVD